MINTYFGIIQIAPSHKVTSGESYDLTVGKYVKEA